MVEQVDIRHCIERPSLCYQSALDLCASLASQWGGPNAVLASSLFYERELLGRLTGEVWLGLPRDLETPQPQNWRVDGLAPDSGYVRSLSRGQTSSELRAILWAEPEKVTWQSTLAEIERISTTATRLCVLGTTGLRYLLPEWQRPGLEPANAPRGQPIDHAIRRRGWTVEGLYGFHGPRSLFWGLVSRFPAVLGRDDLVDRCFAAMRRDHIVYRRQARLAPVWVVAASAKDGRFG